MSIEAGKSVIIPVNTEINSGPSEDSDSIVLNRPIPALIVGKEANGAIPIQLIISGGEIEEQIRFWHQPPKVV